MRDSRFRYISKFRYIEENRFHVLVGLAMALALIVGLSVTSFAQGAQSSAPSASPEQYQGPKKRVAVLDFDVGVKAPQNLGTGMTEMLITALQETGRFIVLERRAVEDILKEQRLGMSGAVRAGTEARVGDLLGAQVLVKGVITEFEEKSTGGGLGIQIGGKGGLVVGMTTGHVAMDIRMFDAGTGVILESHRSEATVTEAAIGVVYGGLTIDLGAAGFQKTPLGKAVRKAIDDSVAFITRKMEAVPWQGRVVSVDGGRIYINAGYALGLRVGDFLEIHRRGQELIDPETGLTLGFELTRAGLGVVEDVQEKFSVARAVAGSAGSKGDVVKLVLPGDVRALLGSYGMSESGVATGQAVPAGGASIVVIIPETQLTRPVPDPAAETEIVKRLVEKGFNVVSQQKVRDIRYGDAVLGSLRDSAAAVRLGRDLGADVAIIGEAFSAFAGTLPSQMVSARARVEVRIIEIATGRILAADAREASAADTSEEIAGKKALAKAASELADYFVPQLLSLLSPKQGSAQVGPQTVSRTTEVVLRSIGSYGQLREFENVLRQVRGVVGAERKSFSDGVARIEVTGSMTPAGLADTLFEQQFGLFEIDITYVDETRLEVRILAGSTS